MKHENDEQILDRVLSGESRLYGVIVDRHKDRAMTLALRLLHHQEEAEEALQDAYVRAYRSLGSFDRRARFTTWLYRIVYNTCLSRLETLRTKEGVIVDDVTLGSLETAPSFERTDASIERAEQSRAVEQAIGALPQHLATVVTLFYVQEMSYEEIVQVTGLPLGTVKTHLFRARNTLRGLLVEELEETL